MRDFDKWLAQFRDSISRYGYYVDFAKGVANDGETRQKILALDKGMMVKYAPTLGELCP